MAREMLWTAGIAGAFRWSWSMDKLWVIMVIIEIFPVPPWAKMIMVIHECAWKINGSSQIQHQVLGLRQFLGRGYKLASLFFSQPHFEVWVWCLDGCSIHVWWMDHGYQFRSLDIPQGKRLGEQSPLSTMTTFFGMSLSCNYSNKSSQSRF